MKRFFKFLAVCFFSTSAFGSSPVIWNPACSSGIYNLANSSCLSAGGGSVNSVTASSPLSSSGGANPNLTCATATGSAAGCLSSADWTTFNSKQSAGNYLTALTGDVAASGPGSASATVANANYKRYINYVTGDDSTGIGSDLRPWKTIQKACTAVTGLATINTPFTIYISGGNNDTDASPITCPPNINLVGDYPLQVGQPITITGGTSNDSVSFTNLIFFGAVTWIRNDASIISMGFRNAEFFSGPIFKQQGSGQASITAYDSVLVNADLLLARTGSFFFNNTILGTTTLGDTNSSAYYEIMGGYNSSAMSISGGAQLYMSGIQTDAPFGATLTGVTTANGTPLIQTDSSSVPSSISGAFTINLISNSNHEAYSAAQPSYWATSAPTNVKDALDRIAAVVSINGATPIP